MEALYFLLLLLAPPSSSGDGGIFASLYSDRRASKVGDIVTILIMEEASASQKAVQDSKREAGLKFDIGAIISRISKLSSILGIGPTSLSGSGSRSSSGAVMRSGSIETRISAKVLEVLENGNMVVEGTRELVINGQRDRITVRGIVRPQDITPDNTVLSTQMADVKISYEGVLRKPGILRKAIGILF
jgi:flagellar L-ring protein precursor FlgH